MSNPLTCKHRQFRADVQVARIVEHEGDEHAKEFRADVTIHCIDCGERFLFTGMPMGLLPIQPTCSADRTEARLPIVPQTEFVMLTARGQGHA